MIQNIEFSFNSTASAPHLFEWQLIDNTYITYVPSTGWSFDLAITKEDSSYGISMNSMSFESVSADSPAIDEGSAVRPVYTYAIPVAAIQKAIAQANSVDYLPIHFYFSFGIGASVNDNTCYADGIVYLKLDSTTKKLSILGGNISGTIEDKNYTLQQSFSYKITTKTDTSEYEDIPTQPQYIFKKSYGTKCWFDLKLPAVIDTTETNSDYPSSPVGKTI